MNEIIRNNLIVATMQVNVQFLQQLQLELSSIGFSVLTARNLDILLRNAESQKGLKTLYHKEKMFLCKQAEQGVPLQAEQYDWLADTDGEIDD
nr:hypothetical protein [Tanacetum cinerariifolium]